MNTEQRDRFIAEQLDAGLSLSDVQKVLADEHGITLTYFDLRLIAADLEVDWAKHESDDDAEDAAAPAAPDPDAVADTPKGTQVTLSKLVRPGAAMSGDVEFASGAKAEWFVDATGRLGLNPAPDSPKPTPEDLQEFQIELQRKLTGNA